MAEKDDNLTNIETIFICVNGMIGGTVLVLPVLALTAGFLTSILTTIAMGIIIGYTAYLTVLHLGRKGHFKQSILEHFNG